MLKGTSWAGSQAVKLATAFLVLLMVAGLAAHGEGARSAVFALSLPLFAWLVWGVERAAMPALAFLKTLPLRTSPKYLTLLPLCTAALLVAAVTTVVSPLPLADGLSMLALSWWAFAVGRWLAPRRSWVVALALPFCCWIPMVPAAFAEQAGGDWAAAAVCLFVALGGLMLSPADQVGAMLSRSGHRATGGRGAPTRSPVCSSVHVSTPRARRGNYLATAWRIWMISTPRGLRYAFAVCMVASAGPAAFYFPLVLGTSFQLPILLGAATATCRSPRNLDFMTTRPISHLRLLLATLAPPGLLALALQLVWLVEVRPSLFIGPDAWLMFSASVSQAERLRYLRDIVGATFLPARLPAGGLPAEAWPALRALLDAHVFRLGLLTVALMYSFVGIIGANARNQSDKLGNRGRWWRFLLLAGIVGGLVPCMPRMWNWRCPWPPAQLWLAACLAVAALVSAGAHRPRPRPNGQGR